MPEVSAVVLAGGQSRRLGCDKAFVQVGGVALIERVIGRARELSDDVVIVTNDPESYLGLGVRLTGDVQPGLGTLGGIYSGLLAARHERVLVVACDMPFLNPGLLRYLVLLSAGYDVAIPNLDGLLEPLHAVYSRQCLGPIEHLLRAGSLRVIGFLDQVRVRAVGRAELEVFDPLHLSILNVNTPEELERAEALAAEERAR